MAGAGAAITLGAAILSLTLDLTDSFRIFMLISGVSVLLGSIGFLRLKPAAIGRVTLSCGVAVTRCHPRRAAPWIFDR